MLMKVNINFNKNVHVGLDYLQKGKDLNIK